jgi:transposase
MRRFVGIDWAHEAHAVCVVDEQGAVVERFEVSHDAKGLAELRRRLAPPAELPIAIERPSGLLVDALVEAGHPVVPIHPNVVAAARSRYRAAASKSDRGDAYLLADLLRTDGHRFRTLLPLSDEIQALRALVRTRDDLVAERVALANQLRALLEGFWPGAATSSPTSTRPSPWPSSSATRRPRPPLRSAISASPPSSPAIATADAAPSPSCSPACATPRRARPAPPRQRPKPRPFAPSSRSSSLWSPRSPASPAPSNTPSAPRPRAKS